MKIFFRRIHLYLAFIAGLVIMTTCFTGAMLVFEDELQHLGNKGRYFVTPGSDIRPVEDLMASLRKKVPGISVSGVKIYTDKSRTVEITYSLKKETNTKKELPGKQTAKPGSKENSRLIAFINPYTAEVVELYNHRDSFFYTMLSLHRWLLGGDTGKLIVGVCTLLFLFILITGIILWWPKTKNILAQRLKIKSNSGWKRLNHDLHIVLGFYSAIFLFLFAFTGLAWSFSWFNKVIYKVTNSSMEQIKPPVCSYIPNTSLLPVDSVFKLVSAKIPAVRFYNIVAPKDSVAAYLVSVLPNDAPHESAIDQYFVNRYEPLLIQVQKFDTRNLGQRVRSTFKPVHTASIWGLPSKIVGLIVCILGVIFPATGYIMWWQRTKKQSKKKTMAKMQEVVYKEKIN